MIQIYGSAGTSAGRCYWTLEEVGVAYEGIPLDFKNADHKSPEYLQLNPNGKVPVLKDGEVILWESMAIDFYLAEKYKPQLSGEKIAERAQILQWSFWALAEYQKPIIEVFIQKVFVPEERRDAKVIEKALEKLQPLNRLLNEQLTNKEYMVGQSFTLADLHLASVAKICSAIGVDLSAFPAIKSWLGNMLLRPAVQRLAKLESK